ncbi:MAG TPA: ABC transporter substrate-binding protein [Hyphomicrobiales bacterium]|nr:ABC transporter substrate-binding protein [Hyphomicrobiales bacterium]
MKRLKLALALTVTLAMTAAANADTIKVGVTIAQTGPAASLGIPQQKTIALLPKEIGGQKIEYIVLDDGSDPTKAVANARKLAGDEKVDVIIGSSISPSSIALIEVASETRTPLISLAASARIVSPVDEKRKWVFKTPQNDSLMAEAIAEHMAEAGVKKVGFIGFSDAYGDSWLAEMKTALGAKKIELVAFERYARSDTSVTGQVLKLIAANPDVILIAGSGTPAALPQKALHERGFKGVIYQTHGAANTDFLRVGGKDVEDTILPVGPVIVAAQLPDSNPVKAVGLRYTQEYEAANGPGSVTAFGAHIYDAGILLTSAIPAALNKAKPGTPEFRSALRDALENLKDVRCAHGVISMTPEDHAGHDKRSRVMVTIKNGTWKLIQ